MHLHQNQSPTNQRQQLQAIKTHEDRSRGQWNRYSNGAISAEDGSQNHEQNSNISHDKQGQQQNREQENTISTGVG